MALPTLPIDNESPTRVVLYTPDPSQLQNPNDVDRGNPLPVVRGMTGWVMDSGGVLRPVQRATYSSLGAPAGGIIVVPAQGAGIAIKVIQIKIWANSFVAYYYRWRSGAAGAYLSGLAGGGVAHFSDWRLNENGHFITGLNEHLNFEFTAGPNNLGLDVMWTQDIP